MMQIFVGRQPVFARSLATVGYELLFRSRENAESAAVIDGDAATAQVLLNAITEIGLDQLVGDRLAFVNLTGRYLADPALIRCLPPDRVVLEVLEDVSTTEDVRLGIERLVEHGYTIALDDFVESGPTATLLEHAHIVKYDLTCVHGDRLRACIERDHAAGRRSLVERIETHEQFRVVADAGADYYQGYFFARPAIVAGVGIPPNTLTLIRLLACVNDPGATVSHIVQVLTQDISMSVKALRFVNSAAMGLRVGIESIEHAAVLVGRDLLRSWTSLALLATVDHKPIELITLALTRAKYCELAGGRHHAQRASTYYTVGMLSLLDAITDSPMAEVVDELGLSEDIREALIGSPGPLTDVLRTAVELERISHLDTCPPVSEQDLQDHRHAMTWATQLIDVVGID